MVSMLQSAVRSVRNTIKERYISESVMRLRFFQTFFKLTLRLVLIQHLDL